MANFTTADWAKAQLKLDGSFQGNELRFRSPEVYKLYLKNTSFMFPNYQAEKTDPARVIEMNYATRTQRDLGSAISHNHQGNQGDSAVLIPTWAAHTDKFVSTVKEANNSIYSLEEMHQTKMMNTIANFAEGMETVASAYTFANRSGVNVATANGTFDETDDVFTISKAENGDQAISITKVAMDANAYQGTPYDVICDSVSWTLFLYQAAQGTSNDTNTSFQFGGVNFILDPKLDAAAAGLATPITLGFWIVIPQGSVGALPWIPSQNRTGLDTKEATYSNMVNPIDGTTLAIHSYEERVNGVSVGGQLQDVKIETEMFLYQALAHTPLSTADETPLLAFGLVD
jgi:hypothetical protein